MAWWERFLGKSPAAAIQKPTLFVVIPQKLAVIVQAHSIRHGETEIPVWTYVTNGMLNVGQKEIAFSLQREPQEAAANFPHDPAYFFGRIYELASKGQLVHAGHSTTFRAANGFLGHFEQVGLTYVKAQPFEGVKLPPPDQMLTAILLMPGEAEVVGQTGSYRITTLLAQTHRYYPCPPWSERKRSAMVTGASLKQSLLGNIPLVKMPEATVHTWLTPSGPSTSDRDVTPGAEAICLRMSRTQLPHIRNILAQLAEEGSCAFLTQPDPSANGRLAWTPQQSQVEVIVDHRTDGSCLTGGFIAFAFGAEAHDSAKLAEDGFVVTLSPASWAKVRRALESGEPIQVEPAISGGKGFVLEWTGSPTVEGAAASSRVAVGTFVIERLMLYQPNEVLQQRIADSQSLTDYIGQIISRSVAFWADRPTGTAQLLTLVTAIKPGCKVRFWTECTKESIPEDCLAAWMEQLHEVAVPIVTQGPVAVAIHVKMFGEPAGQWPPIPKSWQVATVEKNLLVPDEVLQVVWPD